MRFTLTYDGPLHIGGKAPGKQDVRNALHPQMRELWAYPPLSHHQDLVTWQGSGPAEPERRGLSTLTKVGDYFFAPLVSRTMKLAAELDVLFLRPGHAAVLAGQGDIDNRLKVLFDALGIPRLQMLQNAPPPAGIGTETEPFHTLLEDDDLVTRVNVDTARLLGDWPEHFVRVVIRVEVRPTEQIYGNLMFL